MKKSYTNGGKVLTSEETCQTDLEQTNRRTGRRIEKMKRKETEVRVGTMIREGLRKSEKGGGVPLQQSQVPDISQ